MIGNQEILKSYIKKFSHLRQGITKYGKAPHKPILLLTFIELLEKGEIKDNKIFISPELVGLYKENFMLLVNTGHNADFVLPFYHLSGEGFWHINAKLGINIAAYPGSFKALNEVTDYGYFTEDLFLLVFNQETRNILKTVLLDKYFAQSKNDYLKSKLSGGYIQNLEKYLLNESTATYLLPTPNTDEEEQFVRGGLFKKLIP